MVGVRHVLTILAVGELERSIRFYAALGWTEAVVTPVYVELVDPQGVRLGLYQRAGFGRNIGREPIVIPDGEVGPAELYFHCDQLEAAIAALKQHGARELSALAPRDWGDDAAYFADPDGHVLALARPSPRT